MGNEANCDVKFNARAASGKARLETSTLHFRGGDVRLTIPFDKMSKIAVRGETLSITFPDGTATFALGAAEAAKWARRIQHPPSRLEKLGVKADWRASAIGVA